MSANPEKSKTNKLIQPFVGFEFTVSCNPLLSILVCRIYQFVRHFWIKTEKQGIIPLPLNKKQLFAIT
jgi:hypothetical protein